MENYIFEYLLGNLIDVLNEYNSDLIMYVSMIGIAFLLIGIAGTFFGYKLFDSFTGFVCFICGVLLGLELFFTFDDPINNMDRVRVYVLVCSFGCAFLSGRLERLSTVLCAGILGAAFTFLSITQSKVAVLIGVLCAVAAIFFEEYTLIVITSLACGRLLVTGVFLLGITSGKILSVNLFGWVLGIGGILFQLWWKKLSDEGKLNAFGKMVTEIIGNGIVFVLEFVAKLFDRENGQKPTDSPAEYDQNLSDMAIGYGQNPTDHMTGYGQYYAGSDGGHTSDDGEISTISDEQEDTGEDQFNIELTETGNNKVKVIKALQETMRLELAAARDLAESAPCMIKRAVPGAEADKIKTVLEACGAEVTLNKIGAQTAFCKNCGSRLPGNAAFCAKCGMKI